MKTELYLGIDTSNYTTSVSLTDSNGKVLLNYKRLLSVKQGERGLRQSDAVFQHIKNAESAAEAVRQLISEYNGSISAVGVSTTPTYSNGSYMPCFMAGFAEAQMISASLNVPLYTFSHQAGHIMAALYSADALYLRNGHFIAFHVSGGTTDIIDVTPDEDKLIYPVNVGGSLDINAGQVIDRTGVMMGLPFPAGSEMERLALDYVGRRNPPLCSVKGLFCNLSGLENKASELYVRTNDKAAVASYVIDSVGTALSRMLDGAYSKYGDIPVVFAGGVMSCGILRNRLSGAERRFAKPEYASDNACGISLLTYFKHNR